VRRAGERRDNGGRELTALCASAGERGLSQLALFLEHLPGVVWTTDRESRVTQAMGRGLAAAGLDAGQLVGRRIDELPEASPAMVEAHLAAVVRGESSDYEVRYGGRVFEVRVEPVFGGDGAIVGSIGAGSDVTERCELEQRLRAREQEFETLMAHAPDIVIRFDSDLRHLYVNDAVEAVTGLPPERFVGRTNRELGMPGELCALWERELGVVFEHGEARRFEFPFDDGVGGGIRWFEAHVAPERNAAGEVETILSFTRDRTEARRAEQEKLASEARYRELFERAMDMIAVLDREGRLVEVNPAVARTLGYQREELIGRPLSSILAPEEADAGVARFARKLDGSEPACFYQSVLLGKDGRRVPIEASSEVILRDGALHGVLVIARDVSERVAARAALEESERRFRNAFEGAAVGMTLTDPAGTLLRVNAAFAEMLGYRPSELAGVQVGEIVHPDGRAAFADDLEKLRAGLEGRGVAERRYLRKDGEIVLGRVSVSTVRADDGSVLYFVGQIEDVTELRRVQAELDESQALHQVVIESSYDALAVLDLDGTIRLASRSIENTLGYTQQELVGRSFLELLHPDDQQAAQAAVEAALRGAEPSVSRRRTLAKDGSIRLWDGTIAPGRCKDGEPSFLVANAHDVTSQGQLEDKLRHAQKMEAVGRLAGGVAHDFNNLLLVIRGYAELALQKVETRDDSSAEIGEVVAAAEKAASLTGQLLAFSRRQVMNPETFDLRDVVADMVKLLQRLIGENVELTTVWPDDPTLIHADRAQIEQVVANLAVNARDAMPDGGHLSIEVARAADDGQALLIVRDDGRGMDAATGAQIFEPFFTTKGAEGTGLGLSMVHGIISQSGGQIAVDSEPGQGTTFTITLPLADSLSALPEPVAAAPASGGAETILLVEDDPVVKTVITMMLDDRGYRLIPAGSGEEALALARAAPGTVDLLITDLVMCGLNGRETAEAVRTHQPQAKVLYMSGYTDDAVIRVGGFEPGISFLQKPFSGDELARRVRELLDSHAVDVCAVLSSQTPEFASSSSISLSSAPAI